MMTRNERNTEVLEMTRRYPFTVNSPEIMVKCTRKFKESEYLELKSRIETHSKLKQECLIKIIKAYESKKNHYFDIFFERVPYSLREFAHNLNSSELANMKEQLMHLCTTLMYSGIYPTIAEELLGVSK
jgi:hypothetical protein